MCVQRWGSVSFEHHVTLMPEKGRGTELCEEEEDGRGATSLCHHPSPVLFHSVLLPLSVVLIGPQPGFVCIHHSHCPLLPMCNVCLCVYIQAQTLNQHRNIPPFLHSSDLNGITSRSQNEGGRGTSKSEREDS